MLAKITELWKRFLYWIGVSALCCGICLFFGCASSRKDGAIEISQWQENTQMLAMAALEQTDARSLREQLDVPARVQAKIACENEVVDISVDAEVVVPDVSDVPVVSVVPAQFSQKTVSHFFKTLCGDTVMYSNEDADMSKEELTTEIAMLRTWIADEMNREYPHQVAHWTGRVEVMEAQYANAPDTAADKPVADGILRQRQDIDCSTMEAYVTYASVRAKSGEHIWFNAINDGNMREPAIVDYDEMGNMCSAVVPQVGARISYSNVNRYPDGCYGLYAHRWIPRAEETVIPTEATGKLSVTPAQAREAAKQVLAGTGLSPVEVQLVYCRRSDEEAETNPGYLYGVLCTRMIAGIPCAVMDEDAPDVGVYAVGGAEYANKWLYEQCCVLYGNDGIAGFDWEAPVRVQKIVSERTKLLPFSEVLDVFAHMAPVVIEDRFYLEELERYAITVDRIVFCLQRITEAGNVENGLLIPVWNFYGTRTRYFQNGGSADDDGYIRPRIILTVNAINGNVIQSSLGK